MVIEVDSAEKGLREGSRGFSWPLAKATEMTGERIGPRKERESGRKLEGDGRREFEGGIVDFVVVVDVVDKDDGWGDEKGMREDGRGERGWVWPVRGLNIV